MTIELKVPEVGESISEAVIGEWLKQVGDFVAQDEPLVVIETDKVTIELPAPQAGVIEKILKAAGEAAIGEVIGYLDETAEGPSGKETTDSKKASKNKDEAASAENTSADKPADEPAEKSAKKAKAASKAPPDESRVMPAAQRLLAKHDLEASAVEATGPGGRLLKEDVLRHLEQKNAAPTSRPAAATAPAATPAPATASVASASREEESVKMTPLRRRVAERLVSAQQQAALLTTFNEIDMSEVMALRRQYREPFQEKHGIKLGFMSFFVKATIEALKAVPQVNAELRDEHIVFRNYQDIGVAVGGGKGLVVPIVRNAERMSFAEVEKNIAELATRARDNKLKLEDLQGGTFTISNGGIYGSLLSTPIVNPPQSGILGLHKIEERPIALDGQVVIRPMMYVALTYDHRLVDGREAVTFLVRIKECIEDPSRILLEV